MQRWPLAALRSIGISTGHLILHPLTWILPMLRICCWLALSLACFRLDAADLVITGKWMAEESWSKEPAGKAPAGAANGKSRLRYPPGLVVIDLSFDTMTTTFLKPPTMEPKVTTATYTIVQASETSVSILVVEPLQKDGKKIFITKDGTALILADDHTVTRVVPYDPVAVAAERKRVEDGGKPADPLKDQPLAGRLRGAEWIPSRGRRSHFQFDDTGKTIRVNVTVDQPKGFEPSAHPSLILTLPIVPGEYPLSATFNVTRYVPPGSNTVIANGTLVVYRVTEAAIEFGLSARGKDGDVINGRMTADIRPVGDQ